MTGLRHNQGAGRIPSSLCCLACWWGGGCPTVRETGACIDTTVTSASGREDGQGLWEGQAQPGVRGGSLEQAMSMLGLGG